jgi:DNA polymerase III epsilon subunit-like protein
MSEILTKMLVVDLETTGLEARLHGIVQIGAVWLTGGQGEFFLECRAWPGAQIDPGAFKVNGLSPERCEDASLMSEAEAVTKFLQWIGPQPVLLAGLNPSFDRAFLHAAMRRAATGDKLSKSQLFPHRTLDLHSLAVRYALQRQEPVPSRGFYTNEIYALLGMAPEPEPHVALVGAQMEAEAIRRLLA